MVTNNEKKRGGDDRSSLIALQAAEEPETAASIGDCKEENLLNAPEQKWREGLDGKLENRVGWGILLLFTVIYR